MSRLGPDELIAESEIRSALQVHRPDAARFENAVRERIEACRADAAGKDSARPRDASSWLTMAASVIPYPLLAKGAGGALGNGAAANGPWAAKLLAALAAPPVMLLLAIGGFVLGVTRVRSAGRDAPAGSVESAGPDRPTGPVKSTAPVGPPTVDQTMAAWWRTYGAIHVTICIVLVALTFFGHTLPVLLVFLAYGFAIVGLVTRLGSAGLIDRVTLAAGIAPALMLFGQLVGTISMSDRGAFLLDQSLAASLLCFGAAAIALCGAAMATGLWRRIGGVLLTLPLFFLTILYGSSLFWPMTPQDVRTYVETTDANRFGSATWTRWAIAASWLRATDRPFDPTHPKALFQQELAGEQNPIVMAAAFRGGLVDATAAEQIVPQEKPRESLVNPRLRGVRLLSVEQRAAEVLALQQLGRLAPQDRDVIADRLVATIDHATQNERGDLVDVLVATQLLNAIDHGEATMLVRRQVRAMIASFQRLDPQGFGARIGGFARYRATDHGDEVATAVAVELMQTYGVPEEVDALALRSFLRPSSTDWLNRQGAVLRVVALWRFESLADAPPVTWWDYARREHVIGMAILAVLFSFVALFGCPAQLPAQPTPLPKSDAD